MLKYPAARLFGVASLMLACSTGAASSTAWAGESGAESPAPAMSAKSFTPLPAGASPRTVAEAYRIGPGDKLDVVVFEVKDLTLQKLQVDANGQLAFPLIGTVAAAGRTTQELSQAIAQKLSESYLQNPHVSVLLNESASQKVTVDGSVTQPGVYDIPGHTSLLQAVALAKGPDKDADIGHIAVFRQVQGRRMAALFDLKTIRSGQAPDPELNSGDVVVVGSSSAKKFWHELLTALPAIGVFAWF